uniref:Uncharacterized protein n=1 Tax=Siphoviridae sp. cttma3 TaxID=2825708 RepID=A0A8S5V8X3_9CAUD|nr:MAG TPA: hypothetical protein [Siphoviridae sp. cttma3]
MYLVPVLALLFCNLLIFSVVCSGYEKPNIKS